MPSTTTKSSRSKKSSSITIDPSLGHMPPQSIGAEQTVLGALLIDSDAFTLVSELLQAEMFYEPKHQKIYSAILTLNVVEKPVDLVTVSDQLKKDGTF